MDHLVGWGRSLNWKLWTRGPRSNPLEELKRCFQANCATRLEILQNHSLVTSRLEMVSWEGIHSTGQLEPDEEIVINE
jgi:hypothetical protein